MIKTAVLIGPVRVRVGGSCLGRGLARHQSYVSAVCVAAKPAVWFGFFGSQRCCAVRGISLACARVWHEVPESSTASLRNPIFFFVYRNLLHPRCFFSKLLILQQPC